MQVRIGSALLAVLLLPGSVDARAPLEDVWSMQMDRGNDFFAEGLAREAVEHWNSALRTAEALDGPMSLRVAETLRPLALASASLGEHRKAIDFWIRRIDILAVGTGGAELDDTEDYRGLARSQEALRDYEGALVSRRHVYEVRRSVSGQRSSSAALALQELGEAYVLIGDEDRATALFEQILSETAAASERRGAATRAATLRSYAALLGRKGEPKRAAAYVDCAEQIDESIRMLVEKEMESADCEISDTGGSVCTPSRVLPLSIPVCPWAELHRRADDLVLRGQLSDAEGLYWKALGAEDASPLERTTTWRALADVYRRLQNEEASDNALSEALTQFGEGDAGTAAYAGAAKALSVALEEAGRGDEATRLLEDAAHVRLKDAADLLQSAGLVHLRTGNLTAAERAFREAFVILSPDLQSDSDYRRRLAHSALLKLAQAQVELGQETEAIRLIGAALDGSEDAAPDVGLIEVLTLYQGLLESSGRSAEAQEAMRRRARILESVKRQTNAALSGR